MTASKILKAGDTGQLVINLQRVLNAWYPWMCITVDGAFGPKTAESVAEFQKRAGYPVTGIADGQTLHRLGIE
jgi:peptidoglycan hydrolase-like protein with peptidoglycan-binding domain